MKIKLNNKYVRWGLTAFLVIAASICFYYLVFHISNLTANLSAVVDILMPIVFGFILAYLLTPLLNFIERRCLIPLCNKLKVKEGKKRSKAIRGLGILITSCLFFFLIYGLVAMLLSQIVPSIQSIIANFDTYLNNISAWLEELLAHNPEIKEYVTKNLDRYSNELELWLNDTLLTKTSELIKTVSLSVLSTLGVLWDFIIGFIISIYILASKESFSGQAKKIVYAVFERDSANIIINNLRFTHNTFIGFVGGKIVDSIIIGILCFIGTALMQTPYAVLVSVVIGVTNVIPFFGPFLGAIPTGILVFVVDPGHPLNCVYFLLFILALQQFDGNILGPKILGNSTGITGFWVIFSITLFGGLFGVTGMIIGVPLFAVVYAIIKSFVNDSLRRKKLPQDTKSYISLGAIDKDGLHNIDSENYSACSGKRFYSSTDDIQMDNENSQSDTTKADTSDDETSKKKED